MEYNYVAIYLETLEETDFEIQGTPQTIVDFGDSLFIRRCKRRNYSKWDEIIFPLSINGADA